jgi:hypothetical protein
MQPSPPVEIIQEAADSVDRLLRLLKKSNNTQVKSREELQIIKATSLAWFNNYKGNLRIGEPGLAKAVEIEYSSLFEYASRATSRRRYKDVLKKLKNALITLQAQVLLSPLTGGKTFTKPDFSPLAPNTQMQNILENRWEEITKCLECEAPLAATIMMGGLLEALFLAQINRIQDKSPIFRTKAAPKDHKTGKVLSLNEWTLNSYIDVGAELKWITKPTKEVGIVLRNYRNFIHPERELSTGVTLIPEDARMFWSVFTQLAQQIIQKAKATP